MDVRQRRFAGAKVYQAWHRNGEPHHTRKCYPYPIHLSRCKGSEGCRSFRVRLGHVFEKGGGANYCLVLSETVVKVIDLDDTTKVKILDGHTRGVRGVSWHPSGSIVVRRFSLLYDMCPTLSHSPHFRPHAVQTGRSLHGMSPKKSRRLKGC